MRAPSSIGGAFRVNGWPMRIAIYIAVTVIGLAGSDTMADDTEPQTVAPPQEWRCPNHVPIERLRANRAIEELRAMTLGSRASGPN